MNNRTCGNCRWWNRHSGEATGDCQSHPPIYLHEWPATDEADFCGEWADASTTPEQDDRRELVRRLAVAIAGTEWADIENVNNIWSLAVEMADAEPKP